MKKYFTLLTNEGANVGTICASNMDSFLRLCNTALSSHFDATVTMSFNRALTFIDLSSGEDFDVNFHINESPDEEAYTDAGSTSLTWFYEEKE